MNTQNLNESVSDFYSDMFEAFQTLGKIDMEAWENAARTQNDMFTLWASFSKKQYDILTFINDPKDLAEAERELSAEFLELSMELAKRSMGQMNQAMTDTFEHITKSAESGMSALKVTTEAKPAKTPKRKRVAAPKKPVEVQENKQA